MMHGLRNLNQWHRAKPRTLDVTYLFQLCLQLTTPVSPSANLVRSDHHAVRRSITFASATSSANYDYTTSSISRLSTMARTYEYINPSGRRMLISSISPIYSTVPNFDDALPICLRHHTAWITTQHHFVKIETALIVASTMLGQGC